MTVVHRNFIRNPRAHASATAGWYSMTRSTRDANPPVALPDGCDAAFKWAAPGGSGTSVPAALDAIGGHDGLPGGGGVDFSMRFTAYSPLAGRYGAAIRLCAYLYGAAWENRGYFQLDCDDACATQFVEYVLENIEASGPVSLASVYLSIDNGGPTPDFAAHDVWFTKVMFDSSPVSPDYGDGDAGGGWAWDAAAHDSYSTETVEDVLGSNVLINGGASVVFERDVTLALNPGSVAATEMAIRNDEDAYGAWEAFAATKAWTLSAACKVWAKFRDGA